MDEKSKRRIAASLDQPLDEKRDADLVKALENDAQAKAWAEGLKSIDKAMRRWPAPARSAAQWEDFAARLEARLGDAPWESTTRGGSDRFDPLAAPVLEGDDGDSQSVEQKPMSSPDQNDDDDMEALAALTRSSTAPTSLVPPKNVSIRPGPSLHDDAMDDSSGIVDMKQLAEIALRQSAPPPASALAPTKADSEGRADAAVMAGEKPTTKSAAAAVPAANASAESKAVRAVPAVPVDAKPAEPAKKGGAGWVMWLTPVIAAAAAGGFFFFKNSNEHAATNTASNEAPSAEVAPQQSAPATPAATAPAEPVAPPAPPVVAAPAAAPTLAMNDQAAAPTEAARGGAPTTPPVPGQAIAAGGEGRVEHRAAESEGGAAAPRAHAAATQQVAAADRAESAPTTTTTATARTRTASTGTTVAAAEPAAQPAAAAPAPARSAPAASTGAAAPGGARSMDELMAAAVGPHGSSTGSGSAASAAGNIGAGGGAAAPSNSGALPERPSRAQVTATLTPFSSAVRACTQGQTGVATVAMVISHDGAVQSASVSGPFSGDANSCITGVVRRAHFPEFTRPSVPIVYPFSIQPPRPGAN